MVEWSKTYNGSGEQSLLATNRGPTNARLDAACVSPRRVETPPILGIAVGTAALGDVAPRLQRRAPVATLEGIRDVYRDVRLIDNAGGLEGLERLGADLSDPLGAGPQGQFGLVFGGRKPRPRIRRALR